MPHEIFLDGIKILIEVGLTSMSELVSGSGKVLAIQVELGLKDAFN